jgi:hypothetical protein
VLVIALSFLGTPALATSLVFDFEDGTTQGWYFGDNTFLSPTIGLYGEGKTTAVFGFAGSWMSISLDLTDFVTMTWDEFDPRLAPGPRDSLGENAFVIVFPGASPPFDSLGAGTALSRTNPVTRVFDLSNLTGTHTIEIRWQRLLGGEDPDPPLLLSSAFLDNISFFPIPEPSGLTTIVLITFVAGRLLVRRRRYSHDSTYPLHDSLRHNHDFRERIGSIRNRA